MSNEIAKQEDIFSMAKAFRESGYFMDVKTEAQAIVKMQAGSELGIGPFASMQGIEIIQGKCKQSANLQAGLIKRSGKYTYKVVEETATKCRLQFFEISNGAWESLGFVEYTVEEAKQAGLLGKQNWQKHLRDMLFARAVSRGARRFTPDVFLTGAYNEADELDYQIAVPVDTAGLEAIKAKAAQQATVIEAVAVVSEPIVEPVVEPAPEPELVEMVEENSIVPATEHDIELLINTFNECTSLEQLSAVAETAKMCYELTAVQKNKLRKAYTRRKEELNNG